MKENTSGDDLVALIHSMGQSEKRYFRLYLNRSIENVDKDISSLYEHLLQARTWSEAEIRSNFAGKGFLKQLNVIRTRLQQLILDALSRHDHGKTFQLDFARRFNEIDVLFRRKLFSPCRRATKATLRRAKQLELPLFELQAQAWLLRLERQSTGTNLSPLLNQIALRQQELVSQISQEIQLVTLHDMMLALAPQNSIDGPDNQQKINELFQSLNSQFPPAHDLPFDAKILSLHIQSYHARFCNDQNAHFLISQQLTEAWETLPERIHLEEDRYLKTLFAYAESAIDARHQSAFKSANDKLRRLLSRSKSLRPSEYIRIINLEIRFLAESSNWREALAIIPHIQSQLQKFGKSSNPIIRLNLISNVIIALFVCEKWLPIQNWINTLEADPSHKSSPSLDGLTRTTRWVAYYELQEHETLEKSLYPFLKTTKTVVPDPLALSFAGLLACESEAQEISTYQVLQATIQDQQAIGNMPHLDLLDTWVTARIKGISLERAAALRG